MRKNRLYQEDCYASLARQELTRSVRTRDRHRAARLFRWYISLPPRSPARDVAQDVHAKAASPPA